MKTRNDRDGEHEATADGSYDVNWAWKNYVNAILRYQKNLTITHISHRREKEYQESLVSLPKPRLNYLIHEGQAITVNELDEIIAKATPFQIHMLPKIVSDLAERFPHIHDWIKNDDLHLRLEYKKPKYCGSLQGIFPRIPQDATNDLDSHLDELFSAEIVKYIKSEELRGNDNKSAKLLKISLKFQHATLIDLLGMIEKNSPGLVLGAIVLKGMQVAVFNTNHFCYRINYGSKPTIKRMPIINFDIDDGFFSSDNLELHEQLIFNKLNSIFDKWKKNDYDGDLFPDHYSLTSETTCISTMSVSFSMSGKHPPRTYVVYSDGSNREITPEQALIKYQCHLDKDIASQLLKDLSLFTAYTEKKSHLESMKNQKQHSDNQTQHGSPLGWMSMKK